MQQRRLGFLPPAGQIAGQADAALNRRRCPARAARRAPGGPVLRRAVGSISRGRSHDRGDLLLGRGAVALLSQLPRPLLGILQLPVVQRGQVRPRPDAARLDAHGRLDRPLPPGRVCPGFRTECPGSCAPRPGRYRPRSRRSTPASAARNAVRSSPCRRSRAHQRQRAGRLGAHQPRGIVKQRERAPRRRVARLLLQAQHGRGANLRIAVGQRLCEACGDLVVRLDIRRQLQRRGRPSDRRLLAVVRAARAASPARPAIISRAACSASAKCGSFFRFVPYHMSSVASAQRSTSASRAFTARRPRCAAASQSAYSLRSARASSACKSYSLSPDP